MKTAFNQNDTQFIHSFVVGFLNNIFAFTTVHLTLLFLLGLSENELGCVVEFKSF